MDRKPAGIHVEDKRGWYDIAYRGVEGTAKPAEVVNAGRMNQGDI